jgi:alcohol dehydrogenase (NADP+)
MNKMTIDPTQIPKFTLYNGSEIPVVGLGTFGNDTYSNAEIANAVYEAVLMGYRHIDCASVYGNEKEIGQALAKLISSGLIKREELWITSKVWNNMHDEGQVIASCKQTLADLQLDYLDLYLVHWPFPNYHAPGCDVSSRNPDSKPYIHENFMKAWVQMEKLVELGWVRNIGTSNMTIPKMKLLLRDARIMPVVNEMELHPHFQQDDLYCFLKENRIIPIGYSPIGSPRRPERDRTSEDTVDIDDPVVVKIARRLNVHPAIVCLKWAFQRGHVAIPFSVKPAQMFSNLEAATSEKITVEEMEELNTVDKNCRLIKGQVFLWKENQSWEDLWDLDGEIKQ